MGQNSRVIRHPRFIDGPPCLISASTAKAAEPLAQHHSHQGLWGSRFGGWFGSHTKPGALAPPLPVFPNPQPAAPSSLHSSCWLPRAAQGSQLAPFSHGAFLQLVVGDRLCELSSGKPFFIL